MKFYETAQEILSLDHEEKRNVLGVFHTSQWNPFTCFKSGYECSHTITHCIILCVP